MSNEAGDKKSDSKEVTFQRFQVSGKRFRHVYFFDIFLDKIFLFPFKNIFTSNVKIQLRVYKKSVCANFFEHNLF